MASDDVIDFDPDDLAGPTCSIKGPQTGNGRFVRQRDGVGRYGHVKVVITPHTGPHCFRFVWEPQLGSLPKPFMKSACLEGVKAALAQPLTDGRRIAFVQVSIVDGSYHDTDTDEMAVKIAVSMAVQDALTRATLEEF